MAVRNIGQINLVEQQFFQLLPNNAYTLLLSSSTRPDSNDFIINAFSTDGNGRFAGQSTAVIQTASNNKLLDYKYILLVDTKSKNTVLIYSADKNPT